MRPGSPTRRHGVSSRAAEIVQAARAPLPMPVTAASSPTNPLAVAVVRDRLAHEPLAEPFSWWRLAVGLVPGPVRAVLA